MLLIEGVDFVPTRPPDEGERIRLEHAPVPPSPHPTLGDEYVGQVVSGMLVGTQRAKDDLLGILDTIAAERGLVVALEAAQVLHQAMVEGRITGLFYQVPQRPHCGCVIGHLAMALRWEGHAQGSPKVPGWHKSHLMSSPIELWVQNVRTGETVRSSVFLRLLDPWMTEWITKQRALPGDEV